MNLNRSTVTGIGIGTAAAAGIGASAALALRQWRARRAGARLDRPESLRFREVVPGISRAVLSGNPDKGAYTAYTRFEPDRQNPLHTHPNDIRIVVVEGAYLFGGEHGDLRVEAGSTLFLPANLVHTSAADAQDGCLFYEESNGPFDIVPAEH